MPKKAKNYALSSFEKMPVPGIGDQGVVKSIAFTNEKSHVSQPSHEQMFIPKSFFTKKSQTKSGGASLTFSQNSLTRMEKEGIKTYKIMEYPNLPSDSEQVIYTSTVNLAESHLNFGSSVEQFTI